MVTKENKIKIGKHSIPLSEIIEDYRLAWRSRQASLLGRREVMGGKAKFGIFGDGKEVAQIAMAKVFRRGDFRSGYYRDQTFMLALGEYTLAQFFAQLYAHADVEADPASAGRQMNSHFASRSLDDQGQWRSLTDLYNCSADGSPTASQMPRLVGLAYASRLYREDKNLHQFTQFSKKGQEIAFGTIGNASCAEGMFWEAINAVGVLRAPLLMSIWDDEYGISVHNEHQITKEDLTALLSGFKRDKQSRDGYELHQVKGWDYPALIEVYHKAAEQVRKTHVPAIIHVVEVTQPQGHSTSGSHERYKSTDRLAWEKEHDCITQMRQWIIDEGLASESELQHLEEADSAEVEEIRDAAWQAYQAPVLAERQELLQRLHQVAKVSQERQKIEQVARRLESLPRPIRKDLAVAAHRALFETRGTDHESVRQLKDWYKSYDDVNIDRYGSHLHSQSAQAAENVEVVAPKYQQSPARVIGFEVLNACFDAALGRDPRVFAFGEDVGQLGDVNQGFKGMQEKYGQMRVADTGIRECTILGQAIGMAMRGLRPIAEIQYLDYLLYALQIMSDDLATLHWRTRGGQKAPVIIRTRGHRLEGVWHSGSPMGGILHLLRGIHILVPRNMTQAAGFYNTLLRSDEPALVVEVLNGYRLKEAMPDNIGEFTLPLGSVEILREGDDITVVTYGATCRIVQDAAEQLSEAGISCEIIDVRSLLPFDLARDVVRSLQKTNRIVFVDEDVPGGATAYLLQEVMEKQGGYRYLDSAPETITAKAHRPAYGSDGDYWSKPGVEEVFSRIYQVMHEADPRKYPLYL